MKLRPPIKIHGGKHYLASKIIRELPLETCTRYIEVFGGFASVLLNKPFSSFEIYNEIDSRKFNVMYYIKNRCESFVKQLQAAEYCRETWIAANEHFFSPDPFSAAIAYFIRYRMSRGGLGRDFSDSARTRRGMPEGVSAWGTILDQLPAISRRLEPVMLQNLDFRKVMEPNINDTGLCMYIDPPYYPSTRTAKDEYTFELNEDGHRDLAMMCKAAKSKILISGYDCEAYRQWFGSWRKIEILVPNNSGQGKTKERRVECLWRNY